MATLDDLKSTFFDECEELLVELEQGLSRLSAGQGDGDVVNAVFRAVHSIKGGAGIFGFEDLVTFAHSFETALDLMRRGALPNPASVATLLTAGDMLSDLVAMARGGKRAPPDFGADCRAALERLAAPGGAPRKVAGGEAAATDDFEFTPVRADDFGQGARYSIMYRPTRWGASEEADPLVVLRRLKELGSAEIVADIERTPGLSEFSIDTPGMAWRIALETTAPREDIERAFAGLAGEGEATIDAIMEETAPAAAPPRETPEEAAVALSQSAGAERRSAEGGARAPDGATGEALQRATARVDLDKIDRVVNIVGELVIAQAMLGQIAQRLPDEARGQLAQVLDEVLHHTRELKDGVMAMRAQPLRVVFQRMPRLVRELSLKTGKKVRLETVGEGTEVDRTIIERLSDPLTHIIRNSIDHGVEKPETRAAAGKNEEGVITLSASHRGGRIVIEVSDDGGGIDTAKVLERARERGLAPANAALSEDEINNLIFTPGFSTATAISDISGRGVGMDVVRSNIQDLGGRIVLNSQRGVGMTIQLALPLTLAVMDGMMVRTGEEVYVIPISAIVECLRPPRSDVHALIGTRGMLRLRGELVPLVCLGELLSAAPDAKEISEGVVIITEGGEDGRLGLAVDDLLGHQQVVIKNIEDSYGAIPGVAGATILGDGRVAFILDTEKLAHLAAAGFSPLRAGAAAGVFPAVAH